MRYLLFLGLSILSVTQSHGQKIQGVYVGRIFFDRNALVLETNGNQVSGEVYVSEKKHFHFDGTYDKPRLTGVVLFDDDRKIALEGNLKGNSLSISFPDSSQAKMRIVNRVSTKVALNMEDLFSRNFDMLLLGKWIEFKKIDSNGNDVTRAVFRTLEMDFSGQGMSRLSGNLPPLPPEALSWKINWETNHGRLNIVNHLNVKVNGQGMEVNHDYDYVLRNDTIFARLLFNGDLVYMRRK